MFNHFSTTGRHVSVMPEHNRPDAGVDGITVMMLKLATEAKFTVTVAVFSVDILNWLNSYIVGCHGDKNITAGFTC